jgi:hypothetical protein
MIARGLLKLCNTRNRISGCVWEPGCVLWVFSRLSVRARFESVVMPIRAVYKPEMFEDQWEAPAAASLVGRGLCLGFRNVQVVIQDLQTFDPSCLQLSHFPALRQAAAWAKRAQDEI